MRYVRPLGIGLLVTLCLGFIALLTRAVYEGVMQGSLLQGTLSMLIVTAFLIVSGFVVLSTNGRLATASARNCISCGSSLYLTVRSLDRKRLLTCFTCGRETLTA
jgi:hypothetical protein